jgi:TPR repeat protein
MSDRILTEKLIPLGLGVGIGLVLVVLVKVIFGSDSATPGAFAEAEAAFANKNYAASLNLLRPPAEKGDAKAQHGLATHYRYGLGVEQDNASALKWEGLSAARGYAKAESALGAIVLNGDLGVQPNDKQAMSLFQQAADQDDPTGEFYVGYMLNTGRGAPEDDDEAMNWYRKSADQNGAYAQYALGVIYANGRGVAKDQGEALNWFQRAAQNGDDTMKKASAQMITSIGLEQTKVTELLSNLDMYQLKMLMKTMSIMNCGQPIGTKYSMTNFIKDQVFYNTPWPQSIEIASKIATTKCSEAKNTTEVALFD